MVQKEVSRNSNKWERSCSGRDTIYMARWDGKLKHLVNAAPEDFVRWLIKDARFEGELSPNFASRDVDADCLWQIVIKRKLSLLHTEFQVKPISTIGRRLWEHNVAASIKY